MTDELIQHIPKQSFLPTWLYVFIQTDNYICEIKLRSILNNKKLIENYLTIKKYIIFFKHKPKREYLNKIYLNSKKTCSKLSQNYILSQDIMFFNFSSRWHSRLSLSSDRHIASRHRFFSISVSRSKKIASRSGGGFVSKSNINLNLCNN